MTIVDQNPGYEEQLQIGLQLQHLTVGKLRDYVARLDERDVPDQTPVNRSWPDGIITMFTAPAGLYVTIPAPPPPPGEAQA